MVHALPYQNDDKARLHERLPALAAAMGRRAGRDDVVLDSFIISATPFHELCQAYDDGSWDRKRFTAAHILFPVRMQDYDYIDLLVRE